MELTGKQRRFLRSLASPTKATIIIGQTGVTETTMKTLNAALTKDELVKLRLTKASGLDRKVFAPDLAETLDAHLVQIFGSTIVLYRKNEASPLITLP